MRLNRWMVGAATLALAAPAWAGEEPLYQPAPGWVVPAEIPQSRSGPTILVLDEQRRIEGGRLWSYSDRVVRIDSPAMLTALGTLQAAWMPDKGDLVVHNVSILREGKEIDVLAGGARFDVLRRERQLEQRMIDGSYTATLPVPGLRVGDVLRLSYSVSLSDQALDQEVQTFTPLPTRPLEIGNARVRVSWPADADVRWQAGSEVEASEVTTADGFRTIELALPLPEQAQMPEDAPVRYRMGPMLQVGTFAGWEEVSRVMAPLYGTDQAIAAGSPVAREVATIMAAHDGELARAVAALRLVQDEIAYLANGMRGGNYIPQSTALTWENRYGDCKAKTMLLLTMLREMGIEAEAVLVSSTIGDAVPQLLPMPAAFDHVIVRAVIDGTDYWLDGTGSGASMANVHRVPPFAHGLPLRMEGAGLQAMAQRPLQDYDTVLTLRIDERAGADIPALFDAEYTISGSHAGTIRAIIGQATQDQKAEFVEAFLGDALGSHWLIDHALSFDQDRNVAIIEASGTLPSTWEWRRGSGTRSLDLPTAGVEFRPDRARSAWREIPIALAGPLALRTELTLLLPPDEDAIALQGNTDLDEELGGIRLQRSATLSGNVLQVTDSAAWPGDELAPDQVAQARARASSMQNAALSLRAPITAARRHLFAGGGDRSSLAPVEEAYERLVAADADDASRYSDRASFRQWTYARKGAIADLDRAIDLEPSAEMYLRRAHLRQEIGDLGAALADAREAGELEPGLQTSLAIAGIMADLAQVEEAVALVESLDGSGVERSSIVMVLSDLDALRGRPEEGLQRIEGLLAERPGDPTMLNAQCWYQATWNLQGELAETCTRAVEVADWSPAVLDSRAMAYFRLGRHEEALKDLEAALSASPDLAPSLLMRGVVRRAMGDAAGQEDIRTALARAPTLERQYTRFGISLD